MPIRVLVDGEPPAGDHGADVNEDGTGTVVRQRLYQLVRRRDGIGDATFEISFAKSGVEAYVFTFG